MSHSVYIKTAKRKQGNKSFFLCLLIRFVAVALCSAHEGELSYCAPKGDFRL